MTSLSKKNKKITFYYSQLKCSHISQTGTVAQLVNHLLSDCEVVGSIPSQVIPKTLKMVLAALLLGAQHQEGHLRMALFCSPDYQISFESTVF